METQQGKRWPTKAKMRMLFGQGLTFAEIAEWVQRLGDGWDDPPTVSGVKKYYDRIGMPPRRPAANRELIPWRVTAAHRDHLFRRMLDAESRNRRGAKLTDSERRMLTGMHDLLFGRWAMLVFDYSPETGWCLRLREDTDIDIIRAPRQLSLLRRDVQVAMRNASSDRELAEVALASGIHPEALENHGHDAAADILRALMLAAGQEEAPEETQAPAGTPAAPTELASRRRRAAPR